LTKAGATDEHLAMFAAVLVQHVQHHHLNPSEKRARCAAVLKGFELADARIVMVPAVTWRKREKGADEVTVPLYLIGKAGGLVH
jgi:hypothetical protein